MAGKYEANKYPSAAEYVHQLSLYGWAMHIGDVSALGFYALIVLDADDIETIKEQGWKPDDHVSVAGPAAAIVGEQSTGSITVVFYATEDDAMAEWKIIEEDYEKFFDLPNPLGSGEGSW